MENDKSLYYFDPDICRAIDTKIDDQTIRFRLTERKVDRVGDVVLPAGLDLKEYKGNPILLFMHDLYAPSIGKADLKTLDQTDEHLDMNYVFDTTDYFGALLLSKYKNGFMNAGSVRFTPTKINTKIIYEKQTGVIFEKGILKEFSLVTLPVLPGASAIKRGEYQAEIKEFADKLKEYGRWRPEYEDIFRSADDPKYQELQRKLDEALKKVEQFGPIKKAYIQNLLSYSDMKKAYIQTLTDLAKYKKQ